MVKKKIQLYGDIIIYNKSNNSITLSNNWRHIIDLINKKYYLLNINFCRDMSKCFIDKQYIRHKINRNTRIGIYNNKYYSLN